MSEDRKKIIAKLIKIKALAERGVGGEQATAQLMYDTLKKRYGITDEEVSRAAGGTVDITEIDLKQCWGLAFALGVIANNLQDEEALFFKTAKVLGLKPILLKAPKDFLYLLLNERLKFPDSKNRWCTAYLKTAVTDHWIRTHRDILGEKCLFISGERRDESRGRAKLPECEYHSTTLKTERKGKFECHWLRPVLDYEKGKMFEFGKRLGLDPHPCYEYIDRCSCMMCIFAKNEQVMENMKRHPEAMRKWVDAEAKLGFTWKQKTSLQELWDQCFDIDDVTETDTPEQAGGDAGCQQ